MIVKAVIEDLNEILEVQKKAFTIQAKIYDNDKILPLTETLEDLKLDFKRKTILKFVEGGRFIGSVRGMREGNVCSIWRLSVDPECHGKGIGTQLINAIENEFSDVDHYELFTGYKSVRNIHLYQKLGYEIYKESGEAGHIKLVHMKKNNS